MNYLLISDNIKKYIFPLAILFFITLIYIELCLRENKLDDKKNIFMILILCYILTIIHFIFDKKPSYESIESFNKKNSSIMPNSDNKSVKLLYLLVRPLIFGIFTLHKQSNLLALT
jgi:hypothetical protein